MHKKCVSTVEQNDKYNLNTPEVGDKREHSKYPLGGVTDRESKTVNVCGSVNCLLQQSMDLSK